MVTHSCNPSTGEAETGRCLVQDQPGYIVETVSRNMKEEGVKKRQKKGQAGRMVMEIKLQK